MFIISLKCGSTFEVFVFWLISEMKRRNPANCVILQMHLRGLFLNYQIESLIPKACFARYSKICA